MARRSTLALFLSLLLTLASAPAVQAQSAPSYDNFNSALPIALNAKYTTPDVHLATTQTQDQTICGLPSYHSVWFSFVSPLTGTIAISTSGSTINVRPYLSGPNTALSIHTGTLASLVDVACAPSTMGNATITGASITAGTTYFIRVASEFNNILPGSVYKMKTQVIAASSYDPGIVDGSFEAGSSAWVVKNGLNGDARVCGTGEAVAGNCLFKFFGGPAESTKLQQTLNWPTTSLLGHKRHTIFLNANFKTTGTSFNFKATLKVSYSDGTPTSKASRTVGELIGTYTNLNVPVEMASANVSKVKVQFKNGAADGTVLLDLVGVYYVGGLTRDAPLAMPLPAQ